VQSIVIVVYLSTCISEKPRPGSKLHKMFCTC